MASRRPRRQRWTASASHAAARALALSRRGPWRAALVFVIWCPTETLLGWPCIKGADIRSIQELLYQSDLRTTTIYK